MGEFIINSRRGEQVVPSFPIGKINDLSNRVTVLEQSGGSAHIIQDEGSSLTARAKLNFIGTGVTATDNAATGATDVTITSGGGSGDVVGPASAVDNAIARFDAATGKIIQNGVITESDNGDLQAVNSLNYDTTPTSAPTTVGSTSWNTTEDTLDVYGTNVTYQLGQELSPLYKNQTGSTITNGTPVMFAGSLGASGRIKVQPAIANGTIPSVYTIGVTTEDIINGADGHVTWFGKIRGINTTGSLYGETWSDGDILYVSPTTAGYLTKTKPNAPNLQITVAAVINAHATNGTVFVRPTWNHTMADLDDVNGTALTTTGQIAVWNNTAGYFDFTSNINDYVLENTSITGATKTKITYDAKGLVTSGADATTADIAASTNKNYVTDAQAVVIGNTSGTNTGDNATNTQYSGLAGSKQDNITLTTTGTSGAATLIGATLNIPQYAGGSGVPEDSFGIVVDGGGSAVTTGSKGTKYIPWNCTVTGWDIRSDISGSCVFNIKRSGTSISGTEKPTLSAASSNSDLALSTWTTSLSAGDVIEFVVDSASTLTRATVTILVNKV